jgi:hypothetical protein
MSPRFDDTFGVGALAKLEADLTHPQLGRCCATEFPEAFYPQASRDAAVLGLTWTRGGRASVATSREMWFFQWLDAGGARGVGLVAHLALVLDDWDVAEARCAPLDQRAASLLCHCGFRRWTDGPLGERHLLTTQISDAATYARKRQSAHSVGLGGSSTQIDRRGTLLKHDFGAEDTGRLSVLAASRERASHGSSYATGEGT